MKRAVMIAMALVTLGSVALAAQRGPISVKSMPPVVVKTVPQSGDTQVDPATAEIQVTFSKKMGDGNWSWVQMSSETFPKAAGKIHYQEGRKTCVMPVKLQPGRTYVIWLNSQGYQGFRDENGQAAVPYLLVFETRK